MIFIRLKFSKPDKGDLVQRVWYNNPPAACPRGKQLLVYRTASDDTLVQHFVQGHWGWTPALHALRESMRAMSQHHYKKRA